MILTYFKMRRYVKKDCNPDNCNDPGCTWGNLCKDCVFQICSNCADKATHYCSSCTHARYCSNECYKDHLCEHKHVCSPGVKRELVPFLGIPDDVKSGSYSPNDAAINVRDSVNNVIKHGFRFYEGHTGLTTVLRLEHNCWEPLPGDLHKLLHPDAPRNKVEKAKLVKLVNIFLAEKNMWKFDFKSRKYFIGMKKNRLTLSPSLNEKVEISCPFLEATYSAIRQNRLKELGNGEYTINGTDKFYFGGSVDMSMADKNPELIMATKRHCHACHLFVVGPCGDVEIRCLFLEATKRAIRLNRLKQLGNGEYTINDGTNKFYFWGNVDMSMAHENSQLIMATKRHCDAHGLFGFKSGQISW